MQKWGYLWRVNVISLNREFLFVKFNSFSPCLGVDSTQNQQLQSTINLWYHFCLKPKHAVTPKFYLCCFERL